MQQLWVAIVPALSAPPKDARLVIFADPRNYVAEIDSPMMLASAARYAVRHKVYLVPERFIAANYMCMCMLAPNGSVIGAQRATHLNVALRQYNFQRGDRMTPFDTPFGRTALLVDADIYMPQTARAAVNDGAALLISSQYMPLYDFSPDRISYGAVNVARSNGAQVIAVIGTGAAVVGPSGGFIEKYTDSLPLSAQIDPQFSLVDREALKTAKDLLLAHRDLIMDDKKEAQMHV